MLELSKLAAELVGMEYKLQDFTEDVSESEAVAEFEDVLLPKLEKAKRSMTNSEVAFKPPGGQ